MIRLTEQRGKRYEFYIALESEYGSGGGRYWSFHFDTDDRDEVAKAKRYAAGNGLAAFVRDAFANPPQEWPAVRIGPVERSA